MQLVARKYGKLITKMFVFMRRKRCKLVREFFNDVYKTNSGRAIHKQHPLEYEQGSGVCFSFFSLSFISLQIPQLALTLMKPTFLVVIVDTDPSPFNADVFWPE
jgi:hypothetical protein